MKCKYAHRLNDYNFCKVACSYCTLQQKDECRIKHKEYFEEELKPCPFCGGEAKLHEQKHREYASTYYVECKNCECKTIEFLNKDDACERWNTRKPIDRIVEKLRTERDELHEYYNEYRFYGDQVRGAALAHAIDIVKGETEWNGKN